MALLTAYPISDLATQTRRRRWTQYLFQWRVSPHFGVVEGLALALFAAIGALTLPFHEQWDDEAQAWLIARDNSVWQILRHRLHYEGAPPAWHLVLHLFHVAGGTYRGIGWLGLTLATLGIVVWLRWSPFPTLPRLLVPFTFFLQYQYAVIARSYVLFPLLTFTLCVLYTRRRQVTWFAAAAGLLANVSVQGFMVALAFTALYIFDLYRDRARSSSPQSHHSALPSSRSLRRAATLFGLMVVVAVYCAIPAPDLDFAIGDQVSTGTVHTILVALIGETPRNAPKPAPEPKPEPATASSQSDLSDPPPAPIPAVAPPWETDLRGWLTSLIYSPAPKPGATESHSAVRWLFRNVGPNLLEFANQLTWPIAQSNLLACTFLATLALWLRARRRLRMLLPWFMLLIAGQILWTAEHHAGMLLIVLLAACWIGHDTASPPDSNSALERFFPSLITVILVLQITWAAYSIRAEVERPYDPGPETARWLQGQLQAKPNSRLAAFGFFSVSIQPWFKKSPFFDVPTSWWQWCSNVEVDGIHRTIIASHPDIVVYALEFPGYGPMRDQWLPVTHISLEEERDLPHDPIVNDLRAHGYHETHRFCGTRFARFSSAYRLCDMMYEPDPDADFSSAAITDESAPEVRP